LSGFVDERMRCAKSGSAVPGLEKVIAVVTGGLESDEPTQVFAGTALFRPSRVAAAEWSSPEYRSLVAARQMASPAAIPASTATPTHT
jgi:hypothetical protein